MASVSLEGTKKRKRRKFGALARIGKLLHVIRNSDATAARTRPASLQDAVVTNQAPEMPQMLPSGEAGAAWISGVRSSEVTVENVVTCRYSCEHQLQWLDPSLWSALPVDLLELVLGRLPLVKIFDLCVLSTECSKMSKSRNVRTLLAERYPKLFERVGQCTDGEILGEVVYDVRFNEPTPRAFDFTGPFLNVPPFGIHIVNDANAYCRPRKESERRLVCFIPRKKFSTVPILVGNPITDEWEALPCIPFVNKETNEDPAIVQLVIIEDRISYQVTVMFHNFSTKQYAAYRFDSRTGGWTCAESSLPYGDGVPLPSAVAASGSDYYDYDRRTKMLFDLVYRSSLKGAAARRAAMFKDRLFVLRHQGRLIEPCLA